MIEKENESEGKTLKEWSKDVWTRMYVDKTATYICTSVVVPRCETS